MKQSLNQALGRFVHELTYSDLAPKLLDKTKTFLIHNIGVGLAAYETETAQNAIEVAKELGRQTSGATLLVDGSKVALNYAAFANGVMLHSRAQEDDYHPGMIHIGVVVIPAALVVAEAVHCSGKELLSAVASGYEVAARLSKDYVQASSARGFRSTSQYGVIGGAATVGKLLKLGENRITNALGWAANLSCGLLQCSLDKTSEMPFQAGFAASNAVTAGYLARTGAVTSPFMLEGERGFYHAFVGTDGRPEKILKELGSQYEMLDTFFKPFPVGGLAQTPVSTMLSMAVENDITPEQVEQVTVRMNPAEVFYPGANSLRPGLVSVQYCVAVACVHRKVTLGTIVQMDNPKVLNLMRRIRLAPDEMFEPLSCGMNILLKSGQSISVEANVTQQDYCFSLKKDIALIRSLSPEMALPEAKLNKFIELVTNLEDCEDASKLMKILVSPLKRKANRHVLPF